jgi:DNA-binding transcriptional LysR family regulator
MTFQDVRNISQQQLEVLLYLVHEGSFSRAAKKMHLSQPSMTKHIANMEEALGMAVVRRDKSGVVLTPEGKIVFNAARKIFRLRNEAWDKISRIHESESGDIAVVASTIPATYILPHVLSRFQKAYPKIRIRVHSADSEEALEMIRNGEQQIGIVGKKPARGKLTVEPLWKDCLVLAVPENHRWPANHSVTLADIMEEPFILREKGSGTLEALTRYLKVRSHHDLSKFKITAEFGSSEAVKEAILAGLGVSILSNRAIARELKLRLLREVPVEDWQIERSFYLVICRPFNILRHHQLFLDFIRQEQLD